MEYHVDVRQSIRHCDLGSWASLCAERPNPVMDPRFLRAVEASLGKEGKFWNVVFRDRAGRPAAAAFLSLYLVDGLLFMNGGWKKLVAWIRRLMPNFLKVRVLMCGCPVSTGESHLRFAPGADHAGILRQLDRLLRHLALRHQAVVVLFKEFDEEEVTRLDSLTELGYLRVDSLPMNHMPTNFRDFAELSAAMRSRYRNMIKKSQKKFAQAGLRLVHARGKEVESLYTDEAHALYLAVLDHAPIKLECLPPQFFRELARQFPNDLAFTLAYEGQRLAGFASGLFHHDQYLALFCGFDYQLNKASDLYYNLIIGDLDNALRRQLKELHVGQAANDFKVRLGCYTRPRYFYLKMRDFALQQLFRPLANVIFPPLPPLPERTLFHVGDN